MKMGAHFNEEDLFIPGFEYTVGTNDGAQFRKVRFTGTKLYHGNPMLSFRTHEDQQITINPSFHSFTIQETLVHQLKETNKNG